MNLVIIEDVNKKYPPYVHVIHEVEMFICGNIIKINNKNNSLLYVRMDIDAKFLDAKGYMMDQGMF